MHGHLKSVCAHWEREEMQKGTEPERESRQRQQETEWKTDR